MPKRLAPEVDLAVIKFAREGLSQRSIVKELLKDGITISHKTVANIINSIGNRRNHKSVGLSSPKIEHKQHRRSIRTDKLIRQVDALTRKENPLSQNQIAKKLKVSQSTINNIIHQDLGKKTKKKVQVL